MATSGTLTKVIEAVEVAWNVYELGWAHDHYLSTETSMEADNGSMVASHGTHLLHLSLIDREQVSNFLNLATTSGALPKTSTTLSA
jgi:hypothetical protein